MSQIHPSLFDENMEKTLLATIAYDKEALGEVFDILAPDDFYMPSYADIYMAMRKCSQNNEPIDEGFIKKHLGNKFNLDTWVDIVSTNPILDVNKYATELRDKSVKRSLILITDRVPARVASEDSAPNIIDDLSSEIFSLVDYNNTGKVKESPEIIAELLEDYKNIKAAGGGLVGLDTGFSGLNSRTKGFKPGDLIVLAARSGMGKTTFALNLVTKVLYQDKAVAFFSLEMSAVQLMYRVLSIKTSLNLQDIMSGDLNDEEWAQLSDACEEIKTKKLFVYDNHGVSLQQVKSQMLKLKHANPDISLCVIDYIGLMNVSANYKERHLQIAEISRGLKILARELEIPIIVLAQLNRGVESRSNHRPMLSDLRESGAIEQDADLILFVYRDEYYKELEAKENAAKDREAGKAVDNSALFKEGEESEAEIIIGKNRNGPTGTMKLKFQKSLARFVEPIEYSPVSKPLEETTFEE